MGLWDSILSLISPAAPPSIITPPPPPAPEVVTSQPVVASSDGTLLATCLAVSGAFENGGGASYDTVSGNFDGNGLSIGILQWNAGEGTLQQLLVQISQSMTWVTMQTFFKSSIQQLATSNPHDGIQFCLDHYIEAGTTKVDPAALALWQTFLTQPDSIAAQKALAQQTVLSHAKRLVTQYTPSYVNRVRPYAFFFDVCTQEGGMAVGHTVVPPVTSIPDISDVMAFAQAHDPKCASLWQTAVQGDSLAQVLLHYGYARAMLAFPQYQWDTCSRRGTIACRQGIVHETSVDLTSKVD